MRRSLVLTTESARHPFRASLPPHVFERRAEEVENLAPWRARFALYSDDVRNFLTTYCACFVAVFTFIV
ncbi:hypothetical protein FHS61_002612 [Altererythrobacter atlanticus]|uniref:Uncharacterized protein n=1 Tax=Croceibacterium atlanticum TaxID=1267766 RepID=A0A0F7KSX2_9SPHN|nr:hypothetical protein [Croceibacterium atlanticum]AKH41860.1 hypothetical protein WYH_00807 [Croceibacterium atlanticum]MBB5733577.1 hypothetical protein [Croceibacterium atlanticum]